MNKREREMKVVVRKEERTDRAGREEREKKE